MKKLSLLFAIVSALVLLPGCANVAGFIEKVAPKIEAGAEDVGFQFTVDATKLAETVPIFCIEPFGKVGIFLDKIPVLGSLLVDAVGPCDNDTPEDIERNIGL